MGQLMKKWKNISSHTKKWIIFGSVALIILSVGGFFAVRTIIRHDPYAEYTTVYDKLEGKYECQDLFLNAGDSVYFDIDECLKNIGFKPQKIEFGRVTYAPDNYIGKRFKYDDKSKAVTAITGKNAVGEAELTVVIFDGKNKERHQITIARGYVFDIENSIEIKTPQELASINQNLTGRYIIADNIDLSEFENWSTIGSDVAFEGYLINPYGFKIKNLTITSSIKYAGLFGYTNGALIDGLILENVFINASSLDNEYYLWRSTGGIAGYAPNSIIRNCVVQGTIIGSSMQKDVRVGGIAGILDYTSVIGCIFSGAVMIETIDEGGIAGGIAGFGNARSRVVDCFASGKVDAGDYAGGIIGLFSKNGIANNNLFVGSLLNAKHKDEILSNLQV